MYLDADVTLSPNAIAATVEALSGEGCELAAPSIAVGWNDNPVARSYGRVWASTPAVRRHVIGCGMYAVTSEGRTRWDRFPDIISDDKFVRSHFRVDEQRVVPTATLTMYLPTTVRELVRVRSRWCRATANWRRSCHSRCQPANGGATSVPPGTSSPTAACGAPG